MMHRADDVHRPGGSHMPRTSRAADRWQGVIDDFRRSGLEQAVF
jgi:hypothetical protein